MEKKYKVTKEDMKKAIQNWVANESKTLPRCDHCNDYLLDNMCEKAYELDGWVDELVDFNRTFCNNACAQSFEEEWKKYEPSKLKTVTEEK